MGGGGALIGKEVTSHILSVALLKKKNWGHYRLIMFNFLDHTEGNSAVFRN